MGEVSTYDLDTGKEWNDISSEFDEKDIFNADEAVLYHRVTPKQTLEFLVCANMSGI